MRHLALTLMLALAACGGPQKTGAAGKPSLWRPLVTRGARFTLLNYNTPSQPSTDDAILVEVTDVRPVAGAAIARLSWRLGTEDVSDREHIPVQIAVKGADAWFLPAEADDAAVATALAGPPSYRDPQPDVAPTADNGYRFAQTTGTAFGPVTCVGHLRPQGDECEDTCSGMVCFSPDLGIVAVEGTASPNFELYAQKDRTGFLEK